VPHTSAYDPSYRSENGEYSVAKAKALLDLYGYVDKDGDGWRELPDGSPLVLNKSTLPDSTNRQLDEQWQRNMKAIGIRIKFLPAKFQENLKAGRAGKLQMWGLGGLASDPDSIDNLARFDSKQIGGQNWARIKLPQMDAIYQKLNTLPDGPERQALFTEMKRLSVAYMPYKTHVHRYINDMAHPWVMGFRRPVFWNDWWQYVDIDTSRLPGKR
jgi:ABC-type transport system substrate-binding protein